MRVTDLPYEFLSKNVRPSQDLIASAGADDCSILKLPGKLLVTTTDFVNSRPASLTLGIGNLGDVGYLAVVANLSDLLGTGAEPVGVFLGVQLASEHTQVHYEAIQSGALRCLDEYGVHLLGGDTKKGSTLSVYGVGVGTANTELELFLSNRAKPGDPILLSGPIGAFNAAVYALSQPNCPAEIRDDCAGAILRPFLPLEMSRRIASSKKSRAGTDISDGLGANLARLATLSKVGLRVSSQDIPIADLAIRVGDLFEVDPINFAFATGGDWQFVATGPFVPGTCQIGEITNEEDGLILEHHGQRLPLPTEGHDDSRMATFSDEILALMKNQQL